MSTNAVIDRFRVVADEMTIWEVREVEPDRDELPGDDVWLVYAPRSGESKRTRVPRNSLGRLSTEELERTLQNASRG